MQEAGGDLVVRFEHVRAAASDAEVGTAEPASPPTSLMQQVWEATTPDLERLVGVTAWAIAGWGSAGWLGSGEGGTSSAS